MVKQNTLSVLKGDTPRKPEQQRHSLCLHRRLLLLGFFLLLGVRAATAQTPPPTEPTYLWPNAFSKANSDEWLRLHHDQIRQMKPRVLVLNFVNGLGEDEAKRKVEAVITAIRESSRYHAYQNSEAPAFLDYQVFKFVNLTDEVLPPEDQRMDGNSSLYPRPPDWKPGRINFQYAELFKDKFTELYDVRNPDKASQKLSLEEMVNRGMVHEVWFLAAQGQFGAPLECTEAKQVYDTMLRKVAGKSAHAGVGAAEEQPFIGRSLRILHLNPDRGPGFAMEHLSGSLEALSTSKAIPYFTRYFTEYAGFDLDKRFRLPFDRLSNRSNGTEVSYPTPDSMAYQYKGENYTLKNYVAAGGSVRCPPNARRDFDIDNRIPVLSTIEHFCLHDGLKDKDKAEPWTSEKFAGVRRAAPDGLGPWLVYWRQNMPGYGNKALDGLGKPMKNWWPFLFY